VDDVSVQVGQKFNASPKTVAETIAANAAGTGTFPPSQATTKDRDYIAIRWSAHDENDDLLGYTVYYRGDGETRWQVLKDDLADKFYSFESNLLPDGGYTVMVTGNDDPSHSPGMGLRSVGRPSSRFDVDNTPPAISNLMGSVENGKLHIRFNAADGVSIIKRAEFSVDAGDWNFVAPRGEISDSKNASFDFFADIPRVNDPSPNAAINEHVVSLRVYDRADNMASAKIVVKAPSEPQAPASKKK
jgi:hypothetical protein